MENCTLSSMELYEKLLVTLPEFSEWMLQEIIELKRLANTYSDVLDIGCGWGRELKSLAAHCGRAFGIDIDCDEIKTAQEYIGRTSNIFLSFQDGRNLAFPKNYFDLVISIGNTIGNLDDKKDAVIFEMKRVVKPTGKVVISVFSKEATELREKTYSAIGMNIERVDERCIYFSDGYISEGFSPTELENLCEAIGLHGEFRKFGSLATFGFVMKQRQ